MYGSRNNSSTTLSSKGNGKGKEKKEDQEEERPVNDDHGNINEDLHEQNNYSIPDLNMDNCSIPLEDGTSAKEGEKKKEEGLTLLFRKDLTRTDTRRLYIPKGISFPTEATPEGKPFKHSLRVFDSRSKKERTLTVAFMSGTRKMVFISEGWHRFVEEHKLTVHDVIFFYQKNQPQLLNNGDSWQYVIDFKKMTKEDEEVVR